MTFSSVHAGNRPVVPKPRSGGLLDDLTRAVRDRDVERSLASYGVGRTRVRPRRTLCNTRGASRFGAAGGTGSRPSRGRSATNSVLSTWPTGEDVAYAHSSEPRQGDHDERRRARHVVASTLGLRKRDGVWQVRHAHTSVPFDMRRRGRRSASCRRLEEACPKRTVRFRAMRLIVARCEVTYTGRLERVPARVDAAAHAQGGRDRPRPRGRRRLQATELDDAADRRRGRRRRARRPQAGRQERGPARDPAPRDAQRRRRTTWARRRRWRRTAWSAPAGGARGAARGARARGCDSCAASGRPTSARST